MTSAKHSEALRALLQAVAEGALTPEAAHESVMTHEACRPRGDESLSLMEGLTLDTGRDFRTGVPEAVYAPGKRPEAVVAALSGLAARAGKALATRVAPDQAAVVLEGLPDAVYWEEARLMALGHDLGRHEDKASQGAVMVLAAGTSDLPVAYEAYGVCRFLGLDTGFAGDAGVAGLHRLAPHVAALRAARAVIVCAGMEGALPSVVAGLCQSPVLAVPTSVGYGAGAGGFAALMGMLSSCAPGVAVLNIDNGFGAAAFAAKLLARR